MAVKFLASIAANCGLSSIGNRLHLCCVVYALRLNPFKLSFAVGRLDIQAESPVTDSPIPSAPFSATWQHSLLNALFGSPAHDHARFWATPTCMRAMLPGDPV